MTLCHQQGRTQSGPTPAHQQPGPTHTIHSGTNTTRLTSLPGHSCHHRTRQHLQHQYTGNPPIQINIYTGTATTTSQLNKVSSTPWHTGPKQFLHLRIKWTGNFNTSKQHYNTASFLLGPSTSGNTSSPIPTSSPPTPPTPQTTNSPADNKNKATL